MPRCLLLPKILSKDRYYLHNSLRKSTQILPCFIEQSTLLNILSLNIKIINTFKTMCSTCCIGRIKGKTGLEIQTHTHKSSYGHSK